MEGIEIYTKSYNYIQELLKNNCTDKMTIDFSKLDTNTKEVLKKAITTSLTKRRLEISPIIFNVK